MVFVEWFDVLYCVFFQRLHDVVHWSYDVGFRFMMFLQWFYGASFTFLDELFGLTVIIRPF